MVGIPMNNCTKNFQINTYKKCPTLEIIETDEKKVTGPEIDN